MGISLWLEFLCNIFLDVDLGFFFSSVSPSMKLFCCSNPGDFLRVLVFSLLMEFLCDIVLDMFLGFFPFFYLVTFCMFPLLVNLSETANLFSAWGISFRFLTSNLRSLFSTSRASPRLGNF